VDRRQFIGSAGLSALSLAVAAAGGARAAAPARVLPMPLRKGDTVALVSPSSATDEALGACLLEQHRPADALPLFEQTLKAREASAGPDDPWNATSLSGLGRAQLGVGQRTLAVATLTRAVKSLDTSKLDDGLLQKTKQALDQAR